MPPRSSSSEFAELKKLKWIGIAVVVLLAANVTLQVISMAGTKSTMLELIDLTRDMSSAVAPLSALKSEDVRTVVENAVVVSNGAAHFVEAARANLDAAALFGGTSAVLSRVDAAAVARALTDAAAVMRRGAEIIAQIDPDAVRSVLDDAKHVSNETRSIVGRLAVSHNLQVVF
jgi:phosphoserine phosphatase